MRQIKALLLFAIFLLAEYADIFTIFSRIHHVHAIFFPYANRRLCVAYGKSKC